MLTPSPLANRSPFPLRSFNSNDLEDLFSSPYQSPAPAHLPYTISKPQPIMSDDDEGRVFASTGSSTTFAPLFPAASGSQPLRTPIKSNSGRTALASRNLNLNTQLEPPAAAAAANKPLATRTGGGTKRKSPTHCTPLKVDTSASFQRLGRLSPPSFAAKTPEPRDSDALIRKHTDTLRKLRIHDRSENAAGMGQDMDDSGCELDDGVEAVLLRRDKSRKLTIVSNNGKGKEKEEIVEAVSPGGHIAKRRARARKSSADLRETFAFQSPFPQVGYPPHTLSESRSGAHLLRKKPLAHAHAHTHKPYRPRLSSHIAFPAAGSMSYRGRASPGSSSSESGSPAPRRRISAAVTRPPLTMQPPLPPRAPLSRDTPSAATLFFGPTIPQPALSSAVTTTNSSSSSRAPTHQQSLQTAPGNLLLSQSTRERRPSPRTKHTRDPSNRHSYAGSGSTDTFWSNIQQAAHAQRTGSPPLLFWDAATTTTAKSKEKVAAHDAAVVDMDTDTDDDEDMSFEEPLRSSSFSSGHEAADFSFEHLSPLLRPKRPLPSKYHATNRDSLGNYGDCSFSGGTSAAAASFHATATTTGVGATPGKGLRFHSSSDSEESLVTPYVESHSTSWPEPGVHVQQQQTEDVDVDEFIVRTLTAASKGPAPGVKKIPGTPQKKVRTALLGLGGGGMTMMDRPWQSAVASKIGLKEDCEMARKAAPRKSLPAAFPGLEGFGFGKRFGGGGKVHDNHNNNDNSSSSTGVGMMDCSDSEGEEESPSGRKKGKYGNGSSSLGFGHPPPLPPGVSGGGAGGSTKNVQAHLFLPRTRALARRSSSGTFSSSGESASNTPTRTKGAGT